MTWSWRHRLAASGVSAAALAGCLGLHPHWWWMWLAPVPLLVLAVRGSCRGAVLWTTAAALIGGASWLPYMADLQGLPVAVLAWVFTALRWGAVVGAWRWIVGTTPKRSAPWIYAVLWVAAEAVVMAASGNGSWGSLALTQMDDLPVLQIASVFGGAGIVFVVSLGAAALACAWLRGGTLAARSRAVAWPALCVAVVVAAGGGRLASPASWSSMRVGLAVIDLPGSAPPAARQAVWPRYAAAITALAASGAQVVVLPEKIARLLPAAAADRAATLAAVARRTGATVVAGVALDGPDGLRNRAWRFDPDGAATRYDKRRLVPGWEDGFVAGSGIAVRPLGGHPVGLAVCRDLDDGSVAADDARAGVAALLVPAWDFDRDGWMHSRIAVLRGVEYGHGVVRSARNGWLTVSDRLGRVVAERPSAPSPGSLLVADLPLTTGGTTVFARSRDAFAWLCVGAALAVIGTAGRRARNAHSPTSSTASTTL